VSFAYGARECAADIISSLRSRDGDTAGLGEELATPVQDLMRRPDLLTLGVYRQNVHADVAAYLYYDHGLMITINQFRQGSVVPVHDHGTWEGVGVYRGSIDHTLYRETTVDPGDSTSQPRPSDAPLEVVEQRQMSAGDFVSAMPPEHEIHGFTVLEPETLLVVVVGGQYKPVRRYFQVSAGTYFERSERGFRAGR
jgi:predicted metal-dependent enzyme (double-stranded beta helix superfamily)